MIFIEAALILYEGIGLTLHSHATHTAHAARHR
jgi:hypothetical protein